MRKAVTFAGPWNYTGYGTAYRRFVEALSKYGDVPFRTLDTSHLDPHGCNLQPDDKAVLQKFSSTEPGPARAIIQVTVPSAYQTLYQQNYGCFAWETEVVPPGWVEFLNSQSGIWVPTPWGKKVLENNNIHTPISILPNVADPCDVEPAQVTGVRGYTFLSICEPNFRKGWDILVNVFMQVFNGNKDATLVLKMGTKEQALNRLRDIKKETGSTANVILVTEKLRDEQVKALIAACDCLVLPTRGEGWGLPIADAMAAGKPVIATPFGAPGTYMTYGNSYILKYGMALVPENIPLYGRMPLANPEPNHLADLMVHVFNNQEEAKAKGVIAAEDMRMYSAKHIAAILEDRMRGML